MKILKYIFLLILLGLFALSVFVATQKSDFDVERSTVIASPKNTVFNYVNDYRNWENFGSWKTDDPTMAFHYPQYTSGKGASYSWTGADGSGTFKTTAVSEPNEIRQKMDMGNTTANIQWMFKDTTGGTKVTWRSKGRMGFLFKIYAAFHGGAQGVIGTMYERSLANLGKSLDQELKTYNIKIIGRVRKTGTYYLSQRIRSTIDNVPKNIRILMPKLYHFFGKNKITMYGKPFVIYHTYDTSAGIADLSVCFPINEEVFTSPGSDIIPGKLIGFEAVKATLTGDYSHLPETYTKAYAYMREKSIPQNAGAAFVEMYEMGAVQEKHPSKWVTSVYLPVQQKTVVPQSPRVYIPVRQEPIPAAEVTEP